MNVQEIVVEPGFLVIQNSSGPATRYPIADVLRAADIPTGLTYEQVASITTLANLVVTLIRTLISREVLDESFTDGDMDWDLDHIIHSIEQMGGEYYNPDLGD